MKQMFVLISLIAGVLLLAACTYPGGGVDEDLEQIERIASSDDAETGGEGSTDPLGDAAEEGGPTGDGLVTDGSSTEESSNSSPTGVESTGSDEVPNTLEGRSAGSSEADDASVGKEEARASNGKRNGNASGKDKVKDKVDGNNGNGNGPGQMGDTGQSGRGRAVGRDGDPGNSGTSEGRGNAYGHDQFGVEPVETTEGV